jgi:hypothetical protein
VLARKRATSSGRPLSFSTPSAEICTSPAGATSLVHQLPKPSR